MLGVELYLSKSFTGMCSTKRYGFNHFTFDIHVECKFWTCWTQIGYRFARTHGMLCIDETHFQMLN